jgi:predicted lipoprotein with Yx(FWY)xxD motif
MAKAFAILAVLVVIGLAACGDDDDDSASDGDVPAAEQAVADEDAATEPAGDGTAGGKDQAGAGKGEGSAGGGGSDATGIEITTAGSQYGDVLFDADQRAIYYFDKESGPTSECYGDCAVAWPPVLTEGDPQAAGAADAGLLGTTPRDDGTTQVTYDGHPLYYYVDDPTGEVLCHNVEEFGGLWLAVQPSGEAVQ